MEKTLILLLIIPLLGFSQSGEHYLKIKADKPFLINELNQIASIDKITGNNIYVYANQTQYKTLKNRKINYEILPQKYQFGFTGKITDASNGNPIRAKILIMNHNDDNSQVYSDENQGGYYRPVKGWHIHARILQRRL